MDLDIGEWKGRGLTRRRWAAGIPAVLARCSDQGDLAGGEQGRIARITDGDALGLDTGLKVRLAEVEAPAPGYDGQADEPFAAEAREALTSAALGRSARLWYGGLSRDNRGRAIAHVIASDETGADIWLNGLMARQGGARVRTYPENARRTRRLLALEDGARKAKRGLWAMEHWRVRSLNDLVSAPSFAIVEGGLIELERGDGFAQLSPAGVRLETNETLGAPDRELALERGKRIRLRGRIDTRDGPPKIRLTHWAQVEMA